MWLGELTVSTSASMAVDCDVKHQIKQIIKIFDFPIHDMVLLYPTYIMTILIIATNQRVVGHQRA